MLNGILTEDNFTRFFLMSIIPPAVVLLYLYVEYALDVFFKNRRRYLSSTTRYLIKNLLIAIGLDISLISLLFVFCPPASKLQSETDLSTRIESIAKDLDSTSTQLSNIQKELEQRIEYVENLKKEAEIAENVISLTDEQVKAVQSKLNEELNANSEKSLVQDILLNSIFFILGFVAPGFVKVLKSFYDKCTGNKNTPALEDASIQKKVDQLEQLIAEIKNDMT